MKKLYIFYIVKLPFTINSSKISLFIAFEYLQDSEITSVTHGSEESLLDKVHSRFKE